MNTVTLIGQLVDDPASGTSDRGTAWCRMQLRIGGRSGDDLLATVVVFGSLATTCDRWLCGGRLVGVTGRLGHDRGRDGHCVIANAVDFLDSPPEGGGEDAAATATSGAEP